MDTLYPHFNVETLMKKYGIPVLEAGKENKIADSAIQNLKKKVFGENVLSDVTPNANVYETNNLQRQNAMSLTYSQINTPKIFQKRSFVGRGGGAKGRQNILPAALPDTSEKENIE